VIGVVGRNMREEVWNGGEIHLSRSHLYGPGLYLRRRLDAWETNLCGRQQVWQVTGVSKLGVKLAQLQGRSFRDVPEDESTSSMHYPRTLRGPEHGEDESGR
jgi:hypothetical protein